MGLGGLDLNLLLILHALLEQRNVSRAAEQVSLSQPATSAALARLRRHFDDELLVRVGRTYELTPLAQVLCPLVASAVHHVESALEVRSAFAPGLSDRNFVVGASDYALTVMIRPLRRLLRAEAPNVSVTFASMPDDHAFDSYLLHRDLLIGPVGYGLPGRTDVVWRDHFVAILDAHNPAIVGGRLSLRALAELPHAVGVFGTQIPTPADRLLDELGVQRRVVASVDGLLALPFIVEGTDLVALIPERLARRVSTPRSGLAVAEIPNGHRAQLVEAIHCPPSRREDPALQWLRGAILRAARELDDAEDASTALPRAYTPRIPGRPPSVLLRHGSLTHYRSQRAAARPPPSGAHDHCSRQRRIGHGFDQRRDRVRCRRARFSRHLAGQRPALLDRLGVLDACVAEGYP